MSFQKQITKLKSTLEKYWTTLAQLRDLMRSIDETVLAILKPDLDVGELDSIAEQKPDLSRLKEFKKTLLGYSLGQVEDVLKLMQKAEVAQVSETRAGSNIEKAKEAKEEFGRIRKELQTKIPNTEELVQRNITEFASEYLTFVDEDVQVENQYRSTMKNWLSMDALRTTAETKKLTPVVSSEYANSLVKNTVAPAKPSLSSIARSHPPEKCDTPPRHPLNGTANSQEKKQSVEAAAEKPIPPTSSIANLVKDSDSEDEDESKVTSSSSDTSGSQNSESLETSKQDESNEDSEKDHLGDDLSSLPVPFKVVALYPYKAQEEDELDITQGDVIKVMDRDDIEKEPGWLYGKNKRTGKSGMFPTNHVNKAD
uniref:SH3 domain-containing protein n=1 Tax=Schistocephalus solidus TaxID=70667 RepID=A0A0X3NYV9_SCHSO